MSFGGRGGGFSFLRGRIAHVFLKILIYVDVGFKIHLSLLMLAFINAGLLLMLVFVYALMLLVLISLGRSTPLFGKARRRSVRGYGFSLGFYTMINILLAGYCWRYWGFKSGTSKQYSAVWPKRGNMELYSLNHFIFVLFNVIGINIVCHEELIWSIVSRTTDQLQTAPSRSLTI